MNPNAKDISGQKFGHLTAMFPTDERSSGSVVWECLCDCGNHKKARAVRLISGELKSCSRKCTASERKVQKHQHRESYSKERLYRVWDDMKNRCKYPSQGKSYKNYGGRGIKVCDEWVNSYLTFKKWAFENGYDENAPRGQCTLDRIDVDGNYEPSNCRWVSMKIQNNNRRNNVKRECAS